jgi:4-oxalocrotonate tautomerase
MPIIRVEMFAGRTTDQKRRLAKAFTDTVVDVCGLKPQGVQVIFDDMVPSDYAVAGELFSDRSPAPASATPKSG